MDAVSEKPIAVGDRASFAEFIRPNWDVMAALARPLAPAGEAEDVLQDLLDLRAALLELTVRQRSAVVLHYYLALPVAEVAEVLGCSDGTVKSTLSDARSRLRALPGDDYR